MKRKTKSLIAGIIAAAVLITGGIGAFALLSGTKKPREALDEDAVLESGYTQNDINSKEYTLMLENESLELWINEDTTEIKTINKLDGSEWYSTNPERSSDSSKAAMFTLSYMDDKGNLASMNAMSDSVSDGKYQIKRIRDTLRVRYSVGSFSNLTTAPHAVTVERFDEIISAIDDEFNEMKLRDLYYLTDIHEIEDEELKKERLSTYPKLKEQPLYIIRDAAKENPSTLKGVASILASAGYTKEDYEADSVYFSAGKASKAEPGFNITILYKLEGTALTASIAENGLQMRGEFPLTSLTLFPYFASPERSAEGWFLLPDGSGSQMNFYNGKGNGELYKTNIYGDDRAKFSRERLSAGPGASLPVFGIKSGSSAVLCEITRGAAVADITAYPGDESEYAYVNASFDIHAALKSSTTTGRRETFYIVQKERYHGDVEMKFHFLSGENASLGGMASVLRESIFGGREQSSGTSLPVLIEQVGIITRKNQFLGISYNEKVSLTSFEDGRQMALDFIDSGVSDLSVKLTGWFGEGVDHAYISKKTKPAPSLGGKKALTAFLDEMKSKNIPLYLDAEIQYTAKAGSGFSSASSALTMLDQSIGRAYLYDPATFMKSPSRARYINNAAAQVKALENYTDALKALNIENISLRSAGAELAADYGAEPTDRQAMADTVSEYLKALSGKKVLTSGANAYALPYINSAANTPVTSAGFDNTDLSVPFLQMVLRGNVDYYAPAINLSGDVTVELLRAVSAGAGLSCILTTENSDKTAGSDHSYLYSANYSYWKKSLPALFADTQERLQPVAGRGIIDYKQLAQGVFATVYEGGAEVIVNFGSEPFINEGTEIPAKDFAVKGGAQ